MLTIVTTFMPAITSTSSRMHGEFLRLLFLQAHRETTAHFTAIGMPAQQHCDSFRFRRAALYNGLKSKVGLAAAKTAAMRINLNIDGCGFVAPPVHSSLRARPALVSLRAPSSRDVSQTCLKVYIPGRFPIPPGRYAIPPGRFGKPPRAARPLFFAGACGSEACSVEQRRSRSWSGIGFRTWA